MKNLLQMIKYNDEFLYNCLHHDVIFEIRLLHLIDLENFLYIHPNLNAHG